MSIVGQLAKVTVAAQSLPQAAHGSLLAPLRPQYSFQKTEPEASGEVTNHPGPSGSSPIPSLTLVSFFFCFVLWRYEVGDGKLVLINVIFCQHKLTLFQEGVFQL